MSALQTPALDATPLPAGHEIPAHRPAPLRRSDDGAMVGLDGVSLSFGPVVALDDVSLAIAPGEIVCLVGPSGSGKSTLLRVVAGLERPDHGRVVLEGREVDAPGTFVPPETRGVGMVFQDYALFPHLTVAANVAFGLAGRPRSEVDDAVRALLDRVRLSRYAGSYPHVLSGGERQRVALARALAPNPRVLLMDEPFSSLDGRLREQVREETASLLRGTGTTTIVVTHDPAEALRLGDRVALLHRGRVLQVGSADEIYSRPATAFVARFFDEVNELPATCVAGSVDTPVGRLAAPHLPDHAHVTVCIRPQDVHVAPGTTPLAARVLDATFRGGWHDVALELDWHGTPAVVAMRTLGPTVPVRGTAVHLDVDPARVVVVSRDAA